MTDKERQKRFDETVDKILSGTTFHRQDVIDEIWLMSRDFIDPDKNGHDYNKWLEHIFNTCTVDEIFSLVSLEIEQSCVTLTLVHDYPTDWKFLRKKNIQLADMLTQHMKEIRLIHEILT